MNWKIGDDEKFNERSKCFIDQYDQLASDETIDFVGYFAIFYSACKNSLLAIRTMEIIRNIV